MPDMRDRAMAPITLREAMGTLGREDDARHVPGRPMQLKSVRFIRQPTVARSVMGDELQPVPDEDETDPGDEREGKDDPSPRYAPQNRH